MRLFECFDYFVDEANDRSWWPLPADNPESITLLTAAVRLSGRLDDCRTEADLREAVDHTFSLVASGVLETWSIAQESVRVEQEMSDWADATEAKLRTDLESN